MEQGYTEIVTGADVRFERTLKRGGWPMARIGEPRPIGNTMAVAGLLPSGREWFERVRPASYVPVVQPISHVRRCEQLKPLGVLANVVPKSEVKSAPTYHAQAVTQLSVSRAEPRPSARIPPDRVRCAFRPSLRKRASLR